MNKTNTLSSSLFTTLGVDLLLVASACLIPTISHLLAFPLYQLDPMRLVVLLGVAFSINHIAVSNRGMVNSIVIAALLPFLSCLIAGMPTLTKAVLMSAELTTNVALFFLLLKNTKNNWGIFGALVISTLMAKMIYYGLKATCLNMGWLEGTLVGTGLLTQTLSSLMWIALVIILIRNHR